MVLLSLTLAFGVLSVAITRIDRPKPVLAATGAASTDASINLVITPAELETKLDSGSNALRIIDLSTQNHYNEAHVPGAVHAWWQDGMDPYASAYGEVLQVKSGDMNRTAWFQSLGIGPNDDVVVYDDARGRNAARFVWMLNYMGMNSATMLDGGLAAWMAAGYGTTSSGSKVQEAPRLPGPVHDAWLISSTQLATKLNDPGITIVDVRTDAEAREDLNGTIRVGQIPGSKSVPWTALLADANGDLKTNAQLKTVFAPLNVPKSQEIVLYGRFGIDTGLSWLALREAGYTNILIYDQGFATWGKDDSLPIQPRIGVSP